MKKIVLSIIVFTISLSAFSQDKATSKDNNKRPTVKSDEHGSTIDYGHGIIEHTRETEKEAKKRLERENKERSQ
jgi:hypothetical protein